MVRELHITSGYCQRGHAKVVLSRFGDCLSHDYPRDQVFCAYFDNFCVQVVWNKVDVCGRVRSGSGKNEARDRAEFCVSATLDIYRIGLQTVNDVIDDKNVVTKIMS